MHFERCDMCVVCTRCHKMNVPLYHYGTTKEGFDETLCGTCLDTEIGSTMDRIRKGG